MVPVVAAVTGAAVKEILPVPLAAKPIAGLLFVHENVEPGTVVVKVTDTGEPLHVLTFDGWLT